QQVGQGHRLGTERHVDGHGGAPWLGAVGRLGVGVDNLADRGRGVLVVPWGAEPVGVELRMPPDPTVSEYWAAPGGHTPTRWRAARAVMASGQLEILV